MLSIYRCEYAWLPDGIQRDVAIQVEDGYITSVTPDAGGFTRPGITLPGFANAHSHAFHRALRGRTHGGTGDFWTWREEMYRVAAKLDPDSYYRLARAVYAEMAQAGISTVGEFHYLHHAPGGARYNDPNAMGHALIKAADDAGIRITLIDTLYLQAGVAGEQLNEIQLRFSDGDAGAWAERVAGIVGGARIGAAIHSVRAVPPSQMRPVAEFDGPIHAHLSEQRAENEACQELHHCSPAELLKERGVLQEGFTAVHATHLSDADIALMDGAYACFCPTTERDLGDGIGPARALHEAGTQLTLGSDSHAVIDFFEEARALELNERLAAQRRGLFSAAELLTASTKAGHESLGWTDAGLVAAGQRADLVTVALDSVRTAGSSPEGVLFAASTPDITHVMVDGRDIVRDGRHVEIDVAQELRESICALF